MKNSQQLQCIPSITDNSITLFYFFNTHADIDQLNYKILKSIGLPDRIHQGIDDQLKTQELWKKKPYNITRDIKENIHELFHSNDEIKPINTWELNKLAIKLINGKQVDKKKEKEEAQQGYAVSGLALELSKLAQKRLSKCEETDANPQLQLQNILYHQFKTGFAVVTVELSVSSKNLSHIVINEAVYALARFSKLVWRNAQQEVERIKDQKQYSLGDLVRDLLASEKSKNYKRVYTHCYIQFKGTGTTEMTGYLKKLALHYNDEYDLSNEIKNIESIQDFKNVIHILSQEGASTGIAVTENSPEYLLEYKNKVIRPAHMPIHLLIFHAEKAMEQYQINSHVWLTESEPEPTFLNQLQEYQRQLLNFELNFFYPVISDINAHNRLYHNLIKVKQLEQQHKKLSSNNQTISQIIIDNEQQKADEIINRRNKIYCKIAQIGVAAAGYLTSFSIFKETLDIIKDEGWLSDTWPVLARFLDHHAGAINLVSASVIAIAIFIFTWRRCTCAESPHKHTPTDHANHINHLWHFLHIGKSR